MTRTRLLMTLTVAAAACAPATKQEAPAASKPAEAAASKPAKATEAKAAAAQEAMKAAKDLPAAPARGDDANRKSKNGSLTAEIDGIQILVQYGRPEVRDRDIFGDLIPYGEIWRTGADEATTITFSKDAMFAGKKVRRGTYALFTVPGKDGWKVILNSEPKQWGAYKHDPSQDVLKADVTATDHDNTEKLTFAANDGNLQMMWADVAVSIPVSAP